MGKKPLLRKILLFFLPFLTIFLCGNGPSRAFASETELFFKDGRTDWSVELLQPEDPTIRQADIEFKRALKKISGADFPDVADSSGSGRRVKIGVLSEMEKTPDLIRIETEGENLLLVGGSPRSALYAVYEFLRRELGVRWLWPGDDGEFMPVKSEWRLPKLSFSMTPQFKYRGFHMCGDWYRVKEFHHWMARNLLNSHRHGNYSFPDSELGFYRIYSNHNVFPPKEYFKTNPEFYSLRNGKRLECQICVSSRECLEVIADKLTEELKSKPDIDVLSLFLPDNQEYCQCEKCAKKTVSTGFFDFYSDLTDVLKERFPRLRFATLAYQGYLDAPDSPIRNSEFIEIATHDRCNIHRLNDPSCERNVRTMKRFNDWKKTGVAIGNYGYEYDIFSSVNLFLPFFSVLADSVKANGELGSIIILPEVALSPKDGPEERVGTIANRISQYVMARLMTEPDADWKEILRDYCDYAFGPAAKPIFEYLVEMDRQWNSMTIHRGILGTPVGLAEELITPEIRKLAEQRFNEAERLLREAESKAESSTESKAENGAIVSGGESLALNRAAFEREKALFRQWERFSQDENRLEIPRVEEPETMTSPGLQIPGTGSRIFWNEKGITVRNASTPVELGLSTGLGGENWFFRICEDGSREQWKISELGVREALNATWAVRAGKVGEFFIPFALLEVETPLPGTVWQFRLSDSGKVWPPTEYWAGFSFSNALKTGRKLGFWSGSMTRDEAGLKSFASSMKEKGWDVQVARTTEEFLALDPEAYWLKNPMFEEKLAPECWEKVRKDVENGRLVVFLSYSRLPIADFFGDSELDVRVGAIQNISLAQRRSNYWLDGSWMKTPNDLSRPLKRQITPAYYLDLAKPEKWHILATMPKSADELDERLVYVALTRFGKGAILLLSADPRIPLPQILENVQEHFSEFETK